MHSDHTLNALSAQPETKLIPLTQGKFAIVDAADYEWLSQWKWCAQRAGNDQWYAVRGVSTGNSKQQRVRMHRLIMGATSGAEVDHVNHSGLDNRRENLRLATRGQNNCNQPRRKDNTSGFKGVTWDKRGKKWNARIKVNGKYLQLGMFHDLIEAARSYDMAAIKYHGEFAVINFSEVSQ